MSSQEDSDMFVASIPLPSNQTSLAKTDGIKGGWQVSII